jgi:hypothetical protein
MWGAMTKRFRISKWQQPHAPEPIDRRRLLEPKLSPAIGMDHEFPVRVAGLSSHSERVHHQLRGLGRVD